LALHHCRPAKLNPSPLPASTQRFNAASEGSFEWFFLLVDAANDQGLWRKCGLEPEFVPAPGTAAQLKERIDVFQDI
jgi:hypothetical protein